MSANGFWFKLRYPYLKKLNKLLRKRYNGQVTASIERECLVLNGSLDDWKKIVSIGQLAARLARKRCLGVVNNIEFPYAVPTKLPSISDNSLEGATPDVLIIGGGVVGCAIARELSRFKVSILLAEKEHDVAMHASSRNDGVVHPGIDLKIGTQKHYFNSRGNSMYDVLCQELGVPFTRNGQLVCFKNRMFLPVLYGSLIYWRIIGIRGVKVLNRKKLHKVEPDIEADLRSALYFTTAGSVCPYSLTIAYAENAVDNGARVSLDTAVLGMTTEMGKITQVTTNRGVIKPTIVINAAGTFAEDVAKMADDHFFSIHPRKGTNSILDNKYSDTISRKMVSSLGTKSKATHSKGGGVIRTVEDNILVGPDAVETFEKENFATTADSIEKIFARQQKTAPHITQAKIITYFTGVRAPTYEEDFVVRAGAFTKNIIHTAGIQSPGLTAAPAIAVKAAALAAARLGELTERKIEKKNNFNPIVKPIIKSSKLTISARDVLIKENSDYGLIICRCEEISKGEILAALRRPVPCDTVDGVKRRIRAGMGRCQGGFCGPLVTKIIADEKHIPIEQVMKSGPESEILFGSTKGGGQV